MTLISALGYPGLTDNHLVEGKGLWLFFFLYLKFITASFHFSFARDSGMVISIILLDTL